MVEVGGGRLVALEFKASAAPVRRDARHLEWFRETEGERFAAGAILHTGPDVFSLGDRLLAIPISAIWE